MLPDDRALVAQATGGDESAFRLLVDRHARRIYKMAFRVTGHHEDAEDIVQETFVRAFRQLSRFESRAHVGTWLYRIGLNCAIDFVRSRGRRETLAATETIEALAPPSHRPGGDDLVFAGELHQGMERALEELTDQERTAFVMRHVHECPIEEISAALGVRTSAAKHAVFRAVKKMRAALAPFVQHAARVP